MHRKLIGRIKKTAMQIDKSELAHIVSTMLFKIASIVCALYVVGLGFHPFLADHLYTPIQYGFKAGAMAFVSQYVSLCVNHINSEKIKVTTFGMIFIALGIIGLLMLSLTQNDISNQYIYLSATTYYGAMWGTAVGGILFQRIFSK